MKFIDYAVIKVEAGAGGRGCVSFRREKYVPKGGPNGGSGGDGGSVFIVGDGSKSTLYDFHYKSIFKAGRGEHGLGKDQFGRSGEDCFIKIPLGTIVRDKTTNEVIADVCEEGQMFLIARGGRGGRGNKSFATSANRTPIFAEEGEEGESRIVELELKLIAHVGIIGLPNAGKSTFMSVITDASPKISNYPFTTLNPNLGVYNASKEQPIIFADMPGLIEGAHKGVGLGIDFLKHIERTKYLLHLIDSSLDESMIKRYELIRSEIKEYSLNLFEKPEVIVASKIDRANESNLRTFDDYVKNMGLMDRYFKISSYNYLGIEALLKYLENIIEKTE
jgi:GTP-binding protein